VQYPDIRATSKILTLSQAGNIRTAVCSVTANCAFTSGWIVDLPESAERVNIDPFIVAGTVVFVSNVPSSSACESGGHSWLNYVNLLTGGTVPSSASGEASIRLTDALSVGLNYVVLPDGRVIGTSVGSDTSTTSPAIPVDPPSPIGKRVSWREIVK
jgi:type IV pilus assembly protein PilY1